MPVDNGWIYSKYDQTKQETIGFSLRDIARVIGEGSLRLATLCCSEKVNGFSRYRPVKWNQPLLTNMLMNNIQHASHQYWSAQNNTPWIYGDGFEMGAYRPIEATKISMSFDQLVDSAGNINKATMWKINRPVESDWKHQAQFHGYYHKAEPSLRPRVKGGLYKDAVSSNLSYNRGTLHLGMEAQSSRYNSYYALGEQDGTWLPSELLTLVGIPLSAWITVAVRNRNVVTQSGNRWRYSMGSIGQIYNSTLSSGAKTINITSENTKKGTIYHDVTLANATSEFYTAGADGGIYQEARTGDVLDVVVFLTDAKVASVHAMTPPTINGYSLYVREDFKPVKRFFLVASTATTQTRDVTYEWSIVGSITAGGERVLSDTYYFRDGDRIFGFDGLITKIQSSVANGIKVTPDPSDSEIPSGGLTAVAPVVRFEMDTDTPPYESAGGTARTIGKTTEYLAFGVPNFDYYTTLEAAMAGTNPLKLADFLTRIGIKSTDITAMGACLPLVYLHWQYNDGRWQQPTSANLFKVEIDIACRPLFEEYTEFAETKYRGVPKFMGAAKSNILYEY